MRHAGPAQSSMVISFRWPCCLPRSLSAMWSCIIGNLVPQEPVAGHSGHRRCRGKGSSAVPSCPRGSLVTQERTCEGSGHRGKKLPFGLSDHSVDACVLGGGS